METAQANKKQGVTWDLTSFFPEFNCLEMLDFKRKLGSEISQLQAEASGLGALAEDSAPQWENVVLQTEDLAARLTHLYSYIACLKSAHADVEEYAQEEGALMRMLAEFEKLEVELLHAFKGASDDAFNAFLARESLAPVAHPLRKLREKALHTMSREEERLAADLNVDGFRAWSRLYTRMSGKLEMLYPDGRKELKPISQWRALMSDADREIGRAAFEGGNKAWQSVEDICATALNAISGTRLTLYKHQGIDHYLDKALFQASITRETLDAMYQAIHDNIEIGREILRTKASHMGRSGIWWFEREAPLPLEDSKLLAWEQGTEMAERSFAATYPALAQYYRFFLDSKWIESEMRPNKVPGAFCTDSPVTKEQRVYMTFNGTLGDVTTMAHEVGHAFHSHILRGLRPMAQEYPMTLAETASIFAEHILAEGIYQDEGIGQTQKLEVLDKDLCGAAVLLLDITVRFEFEKAFHEERQNGEVSVSRLKELMVAAQRRIFGDALLEGSEDPLFWASKLHFYNTGVSFYNFPYTFGFLLARALYNLFRQQGASFLPQYEEFLLLTGSDTVENVVRRSIGEDISQPAFWAQAIQSLEEPLAQYKELLNA